MKADLMTTNHGGAWIMAIFVLYAMSDWIVDGLLWVLL